jgi:uncharacterized protein YqeY
VPAGVTAHVPILSTAGSIDNVRERHRRGRSVYAMAELKDQLRADLVVAMKARDKLTTATLRMLIAAIQEQEVAGNQVREAAEIYVTNGRGDLAANERAEAQVIDDYLPVQLNDDEVANVVNTAIAQVAEEIGERPGRKQMGKVMAAANAIAEGKADGARLSAAVKDRL